MHEVELIKRVRTKLQSAVDIDSPNLRPPSEETIRRVVFAALEILGIRIAPDGEVVWDYGDDRLRHVFDIVANGGAYQVIEPPHVVAGCTTIDEEIYIVRAGELRKALENATAESTLTHAHAHVGRALEAAYGRNPASTAQVNADVAANDAADADDT